MAQVDDDHSQRLQGQRTALVATRDVTFGLARMYQILSEAMGAPSSVRVFRDRGGAEAWLQEP